MAAHTAQFAAVTVSAGPTTRATPPRTRSLLLLCFGIPLVVMVASYLWLAADHGTLALWDVVVHENGRRTLGQTVFYFSHFLREVPVDLACALFLIGAGSGALGAGVAHPHAGAGATRAGLFAWIAVAGAAVLVVGSLVITASGAGWRSALTDLLQFRTRDDLVAYGSHWRFHWLSTLWVGALAGVAPTVARWVAPGIDLHRNRRWTFIAWGYFVALTIVFGISADVFVDPRFVGHQAREILTHGPVTALLGLAVLLARRRWLETGGSAEATSSLAWPLLALTVAIPLYLILVAATGDVMAAGQTDQGLAAMVAAHYFEHTLDYLLVCLLVGART